MLNSGSPSRDNRSGEDSAEVYGERAAWN